MVLLLGAVVAICCGGVIPNPNSVGASVEIDPFEQSNVPEVETRVADVDASSVELTTFESEAPFTFGVPDGWTVLQGSGFYDGDFNFHIAKDTNVTVLEELIEQYNGRGAPGPVQFNDRTSYEGFEAAFNDPAAQELGYLYISLEGPPENEAFDSGVLWDWDTTEDIALYIADQEPDASPTPVTIGAYEGFSYDNTALVSSQENVVYELLGPDGNRIFATNEIANTLHQAEIQAMIASLELK